MALSNLVGWNGKNSTNGIVAASCGASAHVSGPTCGCGSSHISRAEGTGCGASDRVQKKVTCGCGS